jgi:queuosine precursor transporter
MMSFNSKETRLLLILAAILIANTVLAEFIGVKIFSVEESLGFDKFDMNFFGVDELSFNMSAGVITWPLIFILTDIINEYFGVKQVRFLSLLTAIIVLFCFLVVFVAVKVVPADFWIQNTIDGKLVDMNLAFNVIFGQGMWIIVGSVVAFLFGQLIDVVIFHKIKAWTGEKALWLRATGSTIVSQCIDSFVVIFIAFYLNPQFNWGWKMVFAIGLVNYTYKFIVAICMTPILYLVHAVVDRFLGKEKSEEMRSAAMND